MSGRRLAGSSLVAIVIGVVLLLAACGGSARSPIGASSVVPGKPSAGPVVQVTLQPTRATDPGTLTAAAGVVRRRAGLLGLSVQVAASGQAVVLTGSRPSQAQLAALTAGGALAFRPVLLSAPHASTSPGAGPYGDPGKVDAATRELLARLACTLGTSPGAVDDSWKATVGYTPAQDQYDRPASQIVSCDAQGDKYALSPAALTGKDITGAEPAFLDSGQWVINLTLDAAGASAFATLTTTLYNRYYQPFTASGNTNQNDEALAEVAIVLDGDVQSAPVIAAPITGGKAEISGGGTAFSQDAAADLAAILGGGQLPVGLQVASISVVSSAPPAG